MQIPKHLIDCLNENKIRYEILHHPKVVSFRGYERIVKSHVEDLAVKIQSMKPG